MEENKFDYGKVDDKTAKELQIVEKEINILRLKTKKNRKTN